MGSSDEHPPAPSVTVVLPVRNGADHIAKQLRALAAQTYRGEWEIVVADNGSTDDTTAVAARSAAALPSLPVLRIVDAGPVAGVNRARNAGVSAARGSLVLFCDADDRVEPDWLAALASTLEQGPCAGGRLVRAAPAGVELGDAAFADGLMEWPGFLPFASGANFGVRADVLQEVGGFDERFAGGGDDVEFCWRLQLSGHRLTFAPGAVVEYSEPRTLRGLARQAYRYGTQDALLFRTCRVVGMPPVSVRVALKAWLRLLLLAPMDWRDRTSRRWWVRAIARRAGRVSGSVRYRVVYV